MEQLQYFSIMLNVFFMILIEHPLDTIKTNMQINFDLSFKEVILKIFKAKGLRGFYSGGIPSTAEYLSKHFYRIPLIILLPKFLNSLFNINHVYNLILSGILIANLEVFIISPLERIKVFLMTFLNKDSNYKNVYKYIIKNKTLYQGTTALILKQNTSWISFYLSNYFIIEFFKFFSQSNNLTSNQLLIGSIFTGLINTILIIPLDTIKSNMQKSQNTNLSFVAQAKQIYGSQGCSGFFSSFNIRLLQYITIRFFYNLIHNINSSGK